MKIFDIATFGTSLTSHGVWPEAIGRALTPGKSSRVRIYNLGESGMTSGYGVANVERLIRYRPKVVTIEYNMNDCATSKAVSLAQSEANHVTIINAIKSALPETMIFLMTMNPPIGSAVAARPKFESYNNQYRALAPAMGVGLIDIEPTWAGATTAQIPDGVHPNAAAQIAITVPAITAALASLIT